MGDAGFSYTPIALDEALGLGRALAAGGRSWHIHVLSPSCRYNPLDEGYALLIEDSGQGITYLARSDGFPHVDKDLVRLLHGDDILDESKAGEALADDERAFLDRVRAIDNLHARWHHHMHFPHCVLNPEPGNWAITIEQVGEAPFHCKFDGEPVALLREIELLYFKNLND